MKTPPLLLGAVLLFWGWQSDLLLVGAVMGAVLESHRLFKIRWELSDVDFHRIVTFCTLLSLTLAVYAFSTNESGGTIEGLFHGPGAGHNAAITTVNTATSWLRWLPFVFYFLVLSQVFSTRDALPMSIFSWYWRWREQQEKKLNRKNFVVPTLNITYPYFITCLFSSSIHPNDGGGSFFLGACVLLGWALWPFRSFRFSIVLWVLSLALAYLASFWGQLGIGFIQRDIERYDTRWMMRFMRSFTDPRESLTAIGQIGNLELSGSIVIRLQTPENQLPPTYLREASYRTYQPRHSVWFAGERANNLETVVAQTNQTTWILLPGKTNTASATIACYLNGRAQDDNPVGLLPLPSGSSRLENLNAYILQKDSQGDVIAEGPGLVIFNSFYGRGATIDSPPGTNLDFYVPTNEAPALRHVISEMNLSTHDENKTLNAVDAFFQKNFTYSVWQGEDKLATTNETPLTRFLLHSRSGHCEYFATATVLLLRELKIPARYVVGYYVHESTHSGYVVRERDAHAWCLVWNEKEKTWQDFDTTPPSWVKTEANRASSMQWFSDFWSWVGFQIAKFRWGQGNMRQYILWIAIPILVALLLQIVLRRGRRRQNKSGRKIEAAVFWPGLDSEFYALEQKLAQRGVPRPPDEPLSDWLSRALENPALEDLRAPLDELLQLHYRYRFDPRGLAPRERELLTQKARACLDTLSRIENAPAKV